MCCTRLPESARQRLRRGLLPVPVAKAAGPATKAVGGGLAPLQRRRNTVGADERLAHLRRPLLHRCVPVKRVRSPANSVLVGCCPTLQGGHNERGGIPITSPRFSLTGRRAIASGASWTESKALTAPTRNSKHLAPLQDCKLGRTGTVLLMHAALAMTRITRNSMHAALLIMRITRNSMHVALVMVRITRNSMQRLPRNSRPRLGH